MPKPLFALKSLVPIKGKKGAEKFAKKYGTGFRIAGVGISPAGGYTVDLIKLNDWDHKSNEGWTTKGNKFTVEKLPDGIFINGKKFCEEW